MAATPKFTGVRLEMELRADSPMLHFQPDTPGATVRATEVKPKLDKFLLKKLEKATGLDAAGLKEHPDYKSWFLKEDCDALKYKMQIIAPASESYPAGGTNYGIFYGNMGEGPKKKAVFSNPRVIIQCFHQKLRELLEAYLAEFFLVTNFGTMQGKGFGSFVPAAVSGSELSDKEMKLIAGYLKEAASGAEECYCMRFPKKNATELQGTGKNAYCEKMFKEIKDFYCIMKSGINFKGYAKSFVFKYMLEKKFGNEKAFLKYKGLAPKVATSDAGRKKAAMMKEPEKPRYVRSMLGVGSTLTYREKGKKDVNITISSDEFKRVSSPIFFKIVGNVVFIVAKPVPEELYEKQFLFSVGKKSEVISTPAKGEFDLQEMLAKYVTYYNSELLRSQELPMIRNYKKVEVIR